MMFAPNLVGMGISPRLWRHSAQGEAANELEFLWLHGWSLNSHSIFVDVCVGAMQPA